ALERRKRTARPGRPAPDSDLPLRRGARRLRGPAARVAPGRRRLRPRGLAGSGCGRDCAARPAPLFRVPAPLRGPLRPAPRGARGGFRPGSPGGQSVIGGVPLKDVLLASAPLFTIGVAGALLRRNAISIFLSVEVMMNAANLALIGYGAALGTREGQIVVFFVIALAAAGESVGLAIFVSLFRHTETIDVDEIHILK